MLFCLLIAIYSGWNKFTSVVLLMVALCCGAVSLINWVMRNEK